MTKTTRTTTTTTTTTTAMNPPQTMGVGGSGSSNGNITNITVLGGNKKKKGRKHHHVVLLFLSACSVAFISLQTIVVGGNNISRWYVHGAASRSMDYVMMIASGGGGNNSSSSSSNDEGGDDDTDFDDGDDDRITLSGMTPDSSSKGRPNIDPNAPSVTKTISTTTIKKQTVKIRESTTTNRQQPQQQQQKQMHLQQHKQQQKQQRLQQQQQRQSEDGKKGNKGTTYGQMTTQKEMMTSAQGSGVQSTKRMDQKGTTSNNNNKKTNKSNTYKFRPGISAPPPEPPPPPQSLLQSLVSWWWPWPSKSSPTSSLSSPLPSTTGKFVTTTGVLSKKAADIDWADPIFKPRAGWDMEPIVIEKYKLLFFTVPKVACTTFKMLFRRIHGFRDWDSKGPHNPATNGLRYLGHYPKSIQLKYMTSPDWTRAIFVRDPLARTLSAYMEKGLGNDTGTVSGDYIKRKCCNIMPPPKLAMNATTTNAGSSNVNQPPSMATKTTYNNRDEWLKAVRTSKELPRKANPYRFPVCKDLAPYDRPTDSTNFPFEVFVTTFFRACPDPHWTPQYRRLRAKNWKFINFVGHFESVQEDAQRLLKKIGAWDEYGSNGWGSDKNQSIFETNTAKHQTSSHDFLEDYYHLNISSSTAAAIVGSASSNHINVEELVLQVCRVDYEHSLFNFTKPNNYDLYFGTSKKKGQRRR